MVRNSGYTVTLHNLYSVNTSRASYSMQVNQKNEVKRVKMWLMVEVLGFPRGDS